MIGEGLEVESASGSTQSTSPRELESSLSKVSHLSGTFSQNNQAEICGSLSQSSLQNVQRTNPFPVNRNIVSGKSRNFEALTKGATSVLAACKANSSSLTSVRSEIQTTSSGITRDTNSISGEALMDELLCDFNDFSEDDSNIMDDVQTSSVIENKNLISGELSNQTGTGSADPVLGDDMTAPKESSFFSKLCEGTMYLFTYCRI